MSYSLALLSTHDNPEDDLHVYKFKSHVGGRLTLFFCLLIYLFIFCSRLIEKRALKFTVLV